MILLFLLNILHFKKVHYVRFRDDLYVHPDSRVSEIFVLKNGKLTVAPMGSAKGKGIVHIKPSKNKKMVSVLLDGKKLCFKGPDREIGTCTGSDEEVKWKLCTHKQEYKFIAANGNGNGRNYCMSVENMDQKVVAKECNTNDSKQQFWLIPTKYYMEENYGNDSGSSEEEECDTRDKKTIEDIFEKLFKNEKFDISNLQIPDDAESEVCDDDNDDKKNTHNKQDNDQGQQQDTAPPVQGASTMYYQPAYGTTPFIAVSQPGYQYGQQTPAYYQYGYPPSPQIYPPFSNTGGYNDGSNGTPMSEPVTIAVKAPKSKTAEPKTVVVTSVTEKTILQTKTAVETVTKYISLPQATITQQCTVVKTETKPIPVGGQPANFGNVAKSVVQLSFDNEAKKEKEKKELAAKGNPKLCQEDMEKFNNDLNNKMTDNVMKQMTVKVVACDQGAGKNNGQRGSSAGGNQSCDDASGGSSNNSTGSAVPVVPVANAASGSNSSTPPVVPLIPVVNTPPPVVPIVAAVCSTTPAPFGGSGQPASGSSTSNQGQNSYGDECKSSDGITLGSADMMPSKSDTACDPSLAAENPNTSSSGGIGASADCSSGNNSNENPVQKIGGIDIEFTDDDKKTPKKDDDGLDCDNVLKNMTPAQSSMIDGGNKQDDCKENVPKSEMVSSFDTPNGVVEVYKDENGRYYISGAVPTCDTGSYTLQCK